MGVFSLCISHQLFAEDFAGPIEMQNQYLPSLGRIAGSVRDSSLLSRGGLESRASYLITNSVSRDSNVLVDGESRVLESALRYSLSDSVELGISIPLLWRGAGQFDQFIDSWHKFFGFSEGDRDEVPQDNFSIAGRYPGEDRFDLSDTGFGIGDIELSGKFKLVDQSVQLSARTSIQLPTGGDLFGADEVAIGGELLAGYSFESLALHSGVGIFHYFDSQKDQLIFPKNNFSYFISAEYLLWKKLSAQISAIILTHPFRKITGQHDFQAYIDTGLSWNFETSGILDFSVRENLNDGGNTADVTVLLGYRKKFIVGH